MNIKPLKPTLREKKRYIVYEIDTDDSLNMFEIQKDLLNQISKLLGVFHLAEAGILPIKVDDKTKRGIIKVNHKFVDRIKACFVMIKELNNKEIIIKSLGVSGILKKAINNYFLDNKDEQ